MEAVMIVEQSTITCPKCGHQATEKCRQMPVIFFNCGGCGERLKPLPDDCCVFCSYGSVPCPPIQQNRSCCS
ncbi:MAG TPA: GDCCVxC domain-containing (seleno)protein [Pseudolabrys sp.]